MHGLNVKQNFDAFADLPLGRNDWHQPFIQGFAVGNADTDFRLILPL